MVAGEPVELDLAVDERGGGDDLTVDRRVDDRQRSWRNSTEAAASKS